MQPYDTTSIQSERRTIQEPEKNRGCEEKCGQGEGGETHEAPSEKLFIYGLVCPKTGDIRYVGKCSNVAKRLVAHIKSKRDDHKDYWIRSLLAEGLVPTIEVLEEVTKSSWQRAEIFWIAYLRLLGFRLCNISLGGYGGVSASKEVREKLSRIGKGRSPSQSHRVALSNALKGRAPDPKVVDARRAAGYSREMRDKIAAAQKARAHSPHSEETRRKIGDAHRGRHMSEEQKAKLRGPRNLSPETREKMRQAKLGKKLSPEHRAKLSEVRKGKPGRPMTPEHKAKLIASHLGKPWSEASKEKLRATMRATNAIQRLYAHA